jgi:transposase
VRSASVWARLLGVEKTTVERVDFDELSGVITAHVKPFERERRRCPRCRRRCPKHDQGAGRRQWRALDLGTVTARIEADAPRVRCPEHGVVVAAVPWARHHAGHTRFFDDQVAWLAVQTSKKAVTQLMRIAWLTVGAIITRVCADIDASVDRLEGLRRIGIDEISYKRGQRYLMVVVDHDTGRLVWAAPGRDQATVNAFFDALGEDRCGQLTHVSTDAAEWLADVIEARCPNAERCMDAFHVVAWATEALDVVRRESVAEAQRLLKAEGPGRPGKPKMGQPVAPRPAYERAQSLKKARWPLWKKPSNLSANQRKQVDWIARTDPRLYDAYLMKEGLRHVFELDGDDALEALDRWLILAANSQLPSFVALATTVNRHREPIEAALRHDLSNALVESTNTKIRLLTRIAFGFRSPQALISLAMLALGGYKPPLPGRTHG